MPVTNVIAKVKKINLDNKISGVDWNQAITITLGDIELTDANLIALRKFRPNEEVLINLKTMQLAFGEVEEKQRIKMLEENTDATPTEEPKEPEKPAAINMDQEGDCDIVEGDPIDVSILPADYVDDVDPNAVLKSFTF